MFVRPLLALALALAPISLPAAHAQPGGCPPGLAKKSPSCVPPGQAKKQGYDKRDRHEHERVRDHDHDDDRSRWVMRGDRVIGPDGRVYTVGDRLPGGYIVLTRDEWDRYDRLPRLPDGHRYVRIDNEIVEVIEATNTIVRFLGLLNN